MIESSCARRGLSWKLGPISASEEQQGSGTAAQGGVDSPCLEMSQSPGDVALRDVLGDPRGLLQP